MAIIEAVDRQSFRTDCLNSKPISETDLPIETQEAIARLLAQRAMRRAQNEILRGNSSPENDMLFGTMEPTD